MGAILSSGTGNFVVSFLKPLKLEIPELDLKVEGQRLIHCSDAEFLIHVV